MSKSVYCSLCLGFIVSSQLQGHYPIQNKNIQQMHCHLHSINVSVLMQILICISRKSCEHLFHDILIFRKVQLGDYSPAAQMKIVC